MDSQFEESVMDYFTVFIHDDIKHECIERGKEHYSEIDFKEYILDMYSGWGGDKKNSSIFWEKSKPILKSVLENIGVFQEEDLKRSELRDYLMKVKPFLETVDQMDSFNKKIDNKLGSIHRMVGTMVEPLRNAEISWEKDEKEVLEKLYHNYNSDKLMTTREKGNDMSLRI